MPTTPSSLPPLSPASSTGTASSHALSTPSSSTSPSIPSTDAHTITTTASRSGSVINGLTTLHKRAPPSSIPPPPARFQQMHNMYSSPSSVSSSSFPSAPSTSNKLIKREHPTLGTLHDLQPSANKSQGNRLRKAMYNGDSHKIGLSFNDPDEVVSIADDGYLPADPNSPPPRSATSPQVPPTIRQTATSTEVPPRPEAVRQQSYSKRHASFDTPRTEIPLPFLSERFPRELERHQQRRTESGETPEPPSPTRNSRGPSFAPVSATSSSNSQPCPPSPIPPLNRNDSAPTSLSGPCAASTDVQDLKETESLRDRVEREKEKEVPSIITPPSSEESIGRRSTASLPLPGEHAGEPLYRLKVPPPTPGTFSTSPSPHPLSSIPAPASASFTAPRAFSLPPPPPPAAPEISTPPITLHPLLDVPSSASSSVSNSPPQAHANVLTQSSAPPPTSTSASATTHAPQPTTSTSTAMLNSPPPSHASTATTIATGPQGPHMTVQTTSTAYILQTSLPGYQRDEITLSTRKKRVLHVVADPFISSSRGSGHFERRISFGYDADMAHIRAEFNGNVLKIVVPRRATASMPAGYDSKPGMGGQQGNVWSMYGQ